MMADAGVVRDRLPWLEPYRAPPRNKSNRRAGVTAAVGAAGLAAILIVLLRDSPQPLGGEPAPQASVVLPAPADLQPQIILPPLEAPTEIADSSTVGQATETPRRAAAGRRRISAVPTRAAYRQVIGDQATDAAELQVSEAAIAIASLPLPPDPPRPAVNPAARVVRGKTVQLGVYLTSGQAEAAWRSAIRDYTYLVTMPKSIEPISIRSKRYYRLQLGTPSKKHAKQLCGNLRQIGRSCTVA